MYFLNANLHNHDRVIDTPVKIKAIPILSIMVGCNPKNGNMYNCINIARINPDPTSIKLSIKLLISTLYIGYQRIFVKP
tara:strand:- start:349 stop:585 length:237 start_codon:yes stop_codon:yes gene_type:complete